MATAAVPSATAVELMGLDRAAVVDTRPRDRAAVAYAALWDELRAALGEAG